MDYPQCKICKGYKISVNEYGACDPCWETYISLGEFAQQIHELIVKYGPNMPICHYNRDSPCCSYNPGEWDASKPQLINNDDYIIISKTPF